MTGKNVLIALSCFALGVAAIEAPRWLRNWANHMPRLALVENSNVFDYQNKLYRPVGKFWVVNGDLKCSGRDRKEVREQFSSIAGDHTYAQFCFLPDAQQRSAAYWRFGKLMPECTSFGDIPNVQGDGSIHLRIFWDKSKKGCENPDPCHNNLEGESSQYPGLIKEYNQELAFRKSNGCPSDMIESDEEFRTGISKEDQETEPAIESPQTATSQPEALESKPIQTQVRQLQSEKVFNQELHILFGKLLGGYELPDGRPLEDWQVTELAHQLYSRCVLEGVTTSEDLSTCAFDRGHWKGAQSAN